MDLLELSCTEKNAGQQVHVLVTPAARASESKWTVQVSVQPVKRAALQLQPVKQNMLYMQELHSPKDYSALCLKSLKFIACDL